MAARRSGSAVSLRTVQSQITRWRAHRRKRGAMPPALWEAAVVLAREQGVYRVARALRVDYGTLQRRVGTAAAGGGFVTVAPAVWAAPREGAGAVVEWSAADGSKLVVRLTARDRLDLERLAAAFWRRSS